MLEEVARDRAAVHRRCQSFAEFVKMAWQVIEPGTKLRWNWHLDPVPLVPVDVARGRAQNRRRPVIQQL
jgi:hypothetical protein